MGLRNESLALWINGARIGLWHHAKGAADLVELDRDWAQSGRAVPLSLSLPFGNESERILSGDAVSSFFDNLLLESEHARERLARRFGSPNHRRLFAPEGDGPRLARAPFKSSRPMSSPPMRALPPACP